MSDVNMTRLAERLLGLDLLLTSQRSQEIGYGQALRKAILCMDVFMEVEVLKSLGDLHLKEGKLSKDSGEFNRAAALYAASLLRCTDPDMKQTLEHRLGYLKKLSRQLLQGYTPHLRWLLPDYWGPPDSNVLRVAEICDKVDKHNRESQDSVEETYTVTLVISIENSDMFLELEILKSLGDFYLEKSKKTSDLSQFSHAAAMYKKALARCRDPGTKITLHHRISYAEKIREAVRRQTTLRPRERGPPMGHLFGNITRPDTTQDQPDIPSQYKDHQKKGDSSLAMGDLDSAEEHFAAALKTVHIGDPTAQQYQREVEPLCKLGDVYSKRGQQTGDGGDFVKAAALYNAAIARSEHQVIRDNIATAIEEVEKSFLKCIFNIHYDRGLDDPEKHKKHLKEMRDQIKLEMETIDQQLDPYVHDENDPCVKDIEAKRAQAVRQLFDNIAQQRKAFITLLVEECIGLIGPPPCKYALIGLGSQAAGLVTPYSDLEFVILVEEESEGCLVYFRNLTHYLHLKVVHLGETILPALGIKSLNDFCSKNQRDDWYYDSVTPRGFAFDGSMPKASKTPLGRQGTMDKPSSELICTPNNMASILQKDVTLYLKEGYHLATILRNPCLIAGDQDLIDTYMVITGKILRADGGKMAGQLAQETQKENIRNYMYNNKEAITARLIDVKKNVYRFPALAVDCLALSSHITPTTVWKMIEEMKNKQVISPNNAHHLTVLTSISAELRLRTYIANGGQKENLSALASMETILSQQKSPIQTTEEGEAKAMKPVFHLPNEKQLFRYYYTAVPLKSALSKWSGKNRDLHSFSDFYDNSPRVQGQMYSEVCKYRLAIKYLNEALQTAEGTDTEDTMILLCDIGYANVEVGDYHKGIRYCEQALKVHGKIFEEDKAHPNITVVLHNLGFAWHNLGDQKKAISYCEQAIHMCRSIYGQQAADPYIVVSLNNLGGAWLHEGDYRKAISYVEQALQVNRRIYGETSSHPEIAILLVNLGATCVHMGDYRRGVTYYEQSLQMNRKIYGQTTAHPHIAGTLDNLGGVWDHLGEHMKAVSYHEQALQMYRSIYGHHTAHSDIATSLNRLGSVWQDLGDVQKAISYHQQALEMCRSVFGQTKAHPQVATSLNNLGGDWGILGEHRREVSYLEQALEMFKNIHGLQKAHPDIASILSNLGTASSNLGERRRAVSYHEQALEMFMTIYGQETVHPDIAQSLNNLGAALGRLGELRRAVSYHIQALQMLRSIYGQETVHSDIATTLNNLGSVLLLLGDFRPATVALLEALAMAKQIYPQDQNHPLIKGIEMNLASCIPDVKSFGEA
ncbi:uncharacterized protein LOC144863311 [Branchiostoma floridae x Branchiostoma japonicum]